MTDVVLVHVHRNGGRKQHVRIGVPEIRVNAPPGADDIFGISTNVEDSADSWLEVPADVPRELAERVSELAGKKSKDTGPQ